MKKASDFNTKKEFFEYLVKNKKELVEFKRSVLKFADPFGSADRQAKVVKELSTSYKDDVSSGIIRRSIIGNTYNWLDSHDDVHVDNCFAKSISERHDKIWHLHDHEQKITAKVGKPISIYEKAVAWKDLGVDIEGKTTALFMDSDIIKEYNPIIFLQYLNKEINQHSVGMYYVLLELAVNEPENKEEFAVWQRYINQIGNKEQAMEQGFFWAIKEAKLIEISGVLAGSNELTPTVENKGADDHKSKSFFSKLGQHLGAFAN